MILCVANFSRTFAFYVETSDVTKHRLEVFGLRKGWQVQDDVASFRAYARGWRRLRVPDDDPSTRAPGGLAAVGSGRRRPVVKESARGGEGHQEVQRRGPR